MTRSDLYRASRRYEWTVGLPIIGAALGTTTYCLLLVDSIRTFIESLYFAFGPSVMLPVFIVAALPAVVPYLWLQRRCQRRASRIALIACPHCRANMATRVHTVIATGSCWSCRQAVFDEAEASTLEATRGVDLAEVLANIRRAHRFGIAATLVLLAILVAVFAVVAVCWPDALAFHDRTAVPASTDWVVCVCTLLLFAGIIAILTQNERIMRLRCPQCRRSLSARQIPSTVVATRHCVYCGARVIAGEPAPPPPGACTREELEQAVSRSRSRSIRSLEVYGVAAMAGIGAAMSARVLEADMSWIVLGALYAALFLGIGTTVLLDHRDPALRCPHCGYGFRCSSLPIGPDCVCSHCGNRAVV
jgi:hypothetical protein